MNFHWETRHFVLAGVTAAMTFAAAFALGAGVIVATGIPATGGLANIFVAVLLATVGAQIARVDGFGTLVVGLVFTFAVPTIVGGPPGPQKIINGVLIGLSFDLIIALAGKRVWAYVLAGAVAAMVSIVSIYFTLVLLHLPGIDRLRSLLLPLTLAQGVLGSLGAYVATLIYRKRLRRLVAVQRLSRDASNAGGA